MDTEFNTTKAEFVKVLQKCIDMKWITVDKNISLDGVASQFANAITTIQTDKKALEIIGQLHWMKNYYPETFSGIKSLFKEEQSLISQKEKICK